MGRELRSWTPMTAPLNPNCSQASVLLRFLDSFPISGTWRVSAKFHSLKAQLKRLTFPVACPWLPRTNVVTLISMPPQYFVKHVHYHLGWRGVVNITHQMTPGAKVVFYSFLFLSQCLEHSSYSMDEWMSTSRTSQGSQGRSLQEDSRSTYESNLLEDQSIPSHGDVHRSPPCSR